MAFARGAGHYTVESESDHGRVVAGLYDSCRVQGVQQISALETVPLQFQGGSEKKTGAPALIRLLARVTPAGCRVQAASSSVIPMKSLLSDGAAYAS